MFKTSPNKLDCHGCAWHLAEEGKLQDHQCFIKYKGNLLCILCLIELLNKDCLKGPVQQKIGLQMGSFFCRSTQVVKDALNITQH